MEAKDRRETRVPICMADVPQIRRREEEEEVTAAPELSKPLCRLVLRRIIAMWMSGLWMISEITMLASRVRSPFPKGMLNSALLHGNLSDECVSRFATWWKSVKIFVDTCCLND